MNDSRSASLAWKVVPRRHPRNVEKMMKKTGYIILIMLFLVTGAVAAKADVNEILTFTNFTNEELYIELTIYDHSGVHIYDLYVLPDGTSIADFWADTFDASYSACAYGEITGDFYGCLDGYISDYYNNVYFDNTGVPYLSTPSGLPAEEFIFDNPYASSGVVVVEGEVHSSGGGGGCFIGSLFK